MKQFDHPNGMAVIDDLLIIVEGDKRRIQVLQLPEFVALGVIGEEELMHPYGLYVYSTVPGFYHLHISDHCVPDDEQSASASDPDRRIKHYTFSVRNEEMTTEFIQAFGDIDGAGVLHVGEAITGESESNALLIADEDEWENGIKCYTLDGEITGKVIGEGTFQYQPGGAVLYRQPDGGGFWILADQDHANTTLLVFDRVTHEYIKSFADSEAENADALALSHDDFDEQYRDGLFFSVHDDGSISALCWRDVSESVQLRPH